jgi:hypothetical protein
MPLLTRRRLLIAIPLIALLLIVVAVLVFSRDQGLKSRSTQIAVGMPRGQVEDMLGPPVLTLPRTGGRGMLLVWVDQFWQVDVLTDRDGRVESVGCMPSDSFLRRTVGRLVSLPQ